MNKSSHKRFLASVTMIAALGGFLFGFDMAVVSGIILPVKNQFGLSAAGEGWFVSSALLGCMAGVAGSGLLSDWIGRRKVLFLAAILFLVSAAGFSLAGPYPLLISFRILAGMGVGIASNLSPLYIAEIAPASRRGALVTYYQLAITVGILAAYLSNYFIQVSVLAHPDSFPATLFPGQAWRLMFLVSALPALAFFLLLSRVPESPRWLMQQGRETEALEILRKVQSSREADEAVKAIREINSRPGGKSYALFKAPLAGILLLVASLTALSQFSGINGVIFYGPSILQSAGIVTSDALFYQVILGAANMIFTFVAIWKVDSWGRRPLYIYGSVLAAAALTLTGFCFKYEIHGIWMLSGILLFLLFFAFSLGPLKFVLATEFFPTEVRGRALSICILTMWGSDWLVNMLFPVLKEQLGVPSSFFLFAFFCLVSFLVASRFLVETKGRSLEEIEKLVITQQKAEP